MYKYKVELAPRLDGSVTLIEWLNKQGADGWQMVCRTGDYYYFKRVV